MKTFRTSVSMSLRLISALLFLTGGAGLSAQTSANLELHVTSSAPEVFASSPISYSIAVKNNGPNDATTVVVTSNVDGTQSDVSVAPGAGWTCSFDSGTYVVSCSLPSLAAGASATPIVVNATSTGGRNTILQSAYVLASESDPDTSDNYDAQQVTVHATQADLTISADYPGTADLGQSVSYDHEIQDVGLIDVTGVVVTIDLPPGIAYNSATPDTGTCSYSAPTITCSIGAMSAGSTVHVVVNGTVSMAGTQIVSSEVTANEAEYDPGNNTFDSTTEIGGVTSLTVVNTNDSGSGSLSMALRDADFGLCGSSGGGFARGTPPQDRRPVSNGVSPSSICTINFNISGPTIIAPSRTLMVSAPVIIDGTSQPGYSGTPLIALQGSACDCNDGLRVGGYSTVKGLSFTDFRTALLATGSGHNRIENNWFGLTPGGAAGGNQTAILLQSIDNTVGGDSGKRNVIVNSTYEGILAYPNVIVAELRGRLRPASLFTVVVSGNIIRGNYIGVGPNGSTAMGNSGDGIYLFDATDTIIGGTVSGQGNVIANNLRSGVAVDGASRNNDIVGNAIYANNLLAIDLNDDGATANDADDSDTGPNDIQNWPAISAAQISGGNLNATISYDSTNSGNASHRLDLYRASGTQALSYIGSACTDTTTLTNVVVSVPISGAVSAGNPVIGTLTGFQSTGCSGINGGTSELGTSAVVAGCTPPAIVLSGPSAVCAGSTTVYSVTAIAGATYAWSATGAASTGATNGSTFSVTAGSSGPINVSVTVTDGSGCPATSSKSVSVNPTPVPTINASGSTSFCAGGSVTLSAPAGMTNYLWSPNGETTSSITVSTSGSYSVTVTDGNGCVGTSAPTAVTVTPLPDVTITAASNVCPGSAANSASVPAAPAGTTYNWTVTGGSIVSGQGSNAITYSVPANSTGVTLQVTANNGCPATNSKSVGVTPVNTAITAPAAVCPGSSGNTASVVPSPGATYSWNITNGSITSGQSTDAITFTAGASGTVSLSVTVTAGSCNATGNHSATISASPAATISAPAAVCANSAGNVASVPPQGGATYVWTATNGTITGGQGTNAITFTAGASGNVGLSVTVTSGTCVSNGNVSVPVTAPPSAVITAPASVCASSTNHTASVPATAGATYTWSITGGTIVSGASTNSIVFNAGSSGSVSLGVVVSIGSCSSTGSHNVAITPLPAATITAPASTCPNSAGNIASVSSTPGATYNWTVTNGTLTSGQNTSSITFTAGNSGSVSLGVLVTSGSCNASGTNSTAITAAPAAVISAPASVCAGSTGNNASVAPVAGATYVWTITNGTITAGAGSSVITFTAGATGNVVLGVSVTSGSCTSTGTKSITNTTAPDATITAPARANANSRQSASVASQPGATYTWAITGGTIASGQGTRAITFTAGSGTSLTLNVTVSVGGCSGSSSRTVTINPINPTDLSISKSGPATAGIGAAIVYTIVISNNGPFAANLVTMTDVLPGATTLVSAVSSSMTCSTVGLSATCSMPTLAVGARATVIINALTPRSASTIINTALVTSSTHDNNELNNSASSTTVVDDALIGCAANGRATPIAPAGGTFQTATRDFSWSSVANAAAYRLWVSINDGAPLLFGTTRETTLRKIVPPGTLTWYVETLFNGCPSTESERRTFTLAAAASCGSDRPVPFSPAANATTSNATTTFSWSSVSGAIAYELWVGLDSATPVIVGTTNATSLTTEVAEGRLDWFVRALFNGCPGRDSQRSTFTYDQPAACSGQRAILLAPREGTTTVVSPVSFRWSAVPGATRYDLFVGQGNLTPSLVQSVTTPFANDVELSNGNKTWYVRTHFGASCAALDSTVGNFSVVPQRAACSPLARPILTAPTTISTNVDYTLEWDPVPGATGYIVQRSLTSDFSAPQTLQNSATTATFRDTNDSNGLTTRFYRVRAVDSRCAPQGPFSAIFAVIILPENSIEGTTPAGNPQTVIYDIPLDATLAGQFFEATPNRSWITVTPSTGTVPAGGINLRVTAITTGLPVGTSLGGVNISLTTPTNSRIAANGTTVRTSTISISLVSPVSPASSTTPPPDALIIPAVAHADGINSHFQSDVRVTNTSPQPIKYQVSYRPSGSEPIASGMQTTIDVEGGETLALDDVLKSWFGAGQSTSATGVLEIRPLTETAQSTSGASTSGLPNFVSFAASRTFNATANGSFGQYVPAIPYANFIGGARDTLHSSALTLQQIAQSAQYRTNLGFVEASGSPASLAVSVFGANGARITEFPVELRGGEHLQMNSFLAARGVELNDGRVEVRVTSDAGRVTAYASVLDNTTSDPLLVTPVPLNQASSSKFVLPGVADLSNARANWRTDMRLFNAGAERVDATLTFISQDGGQPRVAVVSLAPNEVKQLDGTLASVFQVTNNGGAVHIATARPANLVATARTYNQTGNGTFGQFISAVTPNEAASIDSRPLQILQIEESDRFRTNIGVAEVNGQSAHVQITIVPPESRTSAILDLDLQPNEFRQLNSLLAAVGMENTYNARISVRVTEGNGRVAAYASVIDSITQDPTFVPAQ